MSEEKRKDYYAILFEASKSHDQDYLLGYIQCLRTHEHISMKEAMFFIDYVVELIYKKRGK